MAYRRWAKSAAWGYGGGYGGVGDYTDADGNLVASNIDTPQGSPSPIPLVSQGPVVNAPASWLSSPAAILAICASAFVGLFMIGTGGRR